MIPAHSHLSVYLSQASIQADHAGQTLSFACEGKQHCIARISSSKWYPPHKRITWFIQLTGEGLCFKQSPETCSDIPFW